MLRTSHFDVIRRTKKHHESMVGPQNPASATNLKAHSMRDPRPTTSAIASSGNETGGKGKRGAPRGTDIQMDGRKDVFNRYGNM